MGLETYPIYATANLKKMKNYRIQRKVLEEEIEQAMAMGDTALTVVRSLRLAMFNIEAHFKGKYR